MRLMCGIHLEVPVYAILGGGAQIEDPMRTASLNYTILAVALLLFGCDDGTGSTYTAPDASSYVDLCTAGDQALILTTLADAGAADGGIEEVRTYSYDCSRRMDCLELTLIGDNEGFQQCWNSCMDESPVSALTHDCRTCWSEVSLACVGDECLLECVGDDRTLCGSCFDEKCGNLLDTCIGF